MSEVLNTSENKRSISSNYDFDSNKTDPQHIEANNQQNQSFGDDEASPRSGDGDSVWSGSTPTSNVLLNPNWEPNNRTPFYLEVEKLSLLTYQLKRENKGLIAKLGEMSYLQQKVKQLEAQNKQLLSENNLKERSPLSRSQNKTTYGQQNSRLKHTHSFSGDISAQNKALTEEVNKLKAKVEALTREKKFSETNKSQYKDLEARLEEAHAQIEFLTNELESKDYEVKGLREKIQQLNEEKESLQTFSNEYRNSLKGEETRESMEIGLKQETKQEEQQLNEEEEFLLNEKSVMMEPEKPREEPSLLKSKSERMFEGMILQEEEAADCLKDMKSQTVDFDNQNSKENVLQGDGSKLMTAKSVFNETVHQLLRDKVISENKITELENKLVMLQNENERINKEWETKWEQMKKEAEDLNEVRKSAEPVQQEFLANELDTEKLLDKRELEGFDDEGKPTDTTVKLIEENVANKKEHIQRNESDDCSEKVLKDDNIEILNDKCLDYAKEIVDLKKSLAINEKELERERRSHSDKYIEFESNLKSLENSLNDTRHSELKLTEENALLKLKLAEYQKQVEELKPNLDALVKEREKFKKLYSNSEIEIQKKDKIIQNYASIEEELRGELQQLRRQNLDTRELIMKYSGEKKRQEKEISHLKALNEDLKNELESLYEVLQQRKEECNLMEKENENLRKQMNEFKQKENISSTSQGKSYTEDLEKEQNDRKNEANEKTNLES